MILTFLFRMHILGFAVLVWGEAVAKPYKPEAGILNSTTLHPKPF